MNSIHTTNLEPVFDNLASYECKCFYSSVGEACLPSTYSCCLQNICQPVRWFVSLAIVFFDHLRHPSSQTKKKNKQILFSFIELNKSLIQSQYSFQYRSIFFFLCHYTSKSNVKMSTRKIMQYKRVKSILKTWGQRKRVSIIMIKRLRTRGIEHSIVKVNQWKTINIDYNQ